WWFNSSLGLCQGFIFGGCNGNKNNFQSERECQQSCAHLSPSDAPRTLPAYCAMPPDTGPCRAAFPRWFFDAASSSCQQFIYGGCRGNSNNYDSEAECRSHC
ncbi:SPIT2 inhibitor, partial [Rhinopomastus cyanomelas]|nr:SPIT2 inhibitor [Rhinopomastus cyanomelas]